MKIKLTPAFVMRAKAEPGKERSIYWDTVVRGLGLVVTDRGAKSYVVQYRAGPQSRRMKLGNIQNLAAARQQAKVVLGKVASGHDPLMARRKEKAAAADTLRAVAAEYLKRDGKGLRTVAQRVATLERLVYPTLGSRQIADIRRKDIVRLLDRIEDECGPVMADRTLATIQRLMNWHASRDDDFRSPIVRGMARTKPSERARKRILTDDELRAVWNAAEASNGPFGYLTRFWLLTATRRNEAANMRRAELNGSDWTIPAARAKGKADVLLPLSSAALALLEKMPRLGQDADRGYVFTINGAKPISTFSRSKSDLDQASGVTDWHIHDLRRTARSLLSRAGVDADIAERCLGHVIGGVRGTYDRHEYRDEKARAFEALAALIARIVNPEENVVPLARPAS